jgi:hypothetical protein
MDYIKYDFTIELKKYIDVIYNKVESIALKDGIFQHLDIYFTVCTTNSSDGKYCFENDDRYHFCCVERGNIITDKVTQSLFELSYWVIESQIFWMAFQYNVKIELIIKTQEE